MFVDESGDTGLVNSPTRYFALAGMVVHELRWRTYLDQLIAYRQRMRNQFGLKLREEIHATKLISRPGSLVRIKRNDRLTILRAFADELASMPDINIINVLVDKQGKPTNYDAFGSAWQALIQRFENTMSHRNFPGPANPDERGMIFPDNTDDKKLVALLRRMRQYNPVPNQPHFGGGYRNLTLSTIVEDPSFRDSEFSYFIQAADVAAYLLFQHMAPNAYMRRKGGRAYFGRLDPVLCKVAATHDPEGRVRL